MSFHSVGWRAFVPRKLLYVWVPWVCDLGRRCSGKCKYKLFYRGETETRPDEVVSDEPGEFVRLRMIMFWEVSSLRFAPWAVRATMPGLRTLLLTTIVVGIEWVWRGVSSARLWLWRRWLPVSGDSFSSDVVCESSVLCEDELLVTDVIIEQQYNSWKQ